MAKLRLTKTALKAQRDALQRYLRFLPTLELKKKQLIQEIQRVEEKLQDRMTEEQRLRAGMAAWLSLFAEPVGFESLVSLNRVETTEANIAGVAIPVFVKAWFDITPYDLENMPLWVDRGVDMVQRLGSFAAERAVLQQQKDLLGRELRVTIQRINLFEKVKIPEARDYIRRIQIYLGDQQANAVARGKIAKGKLADVQMATYV